MELDRLVDVDLSLLLVLQVLLEEESVTRAARRLGRSQPAVSRSLGRLRELLDDPLFVREGAGLVPTPRARALVEPLADALSLVQTGILSAPTFDPASDTRTVRILSTDFAEATLLAPAVAHLLALAPGLDVVLIKPSTGRSVSEVLRDGVELALSPVRGNEASTRAVRVGTERFACLVRGDHPVLATGLDLDAYVALSHVLVAPGGTAGGIVDDALTRLGRTRRVAVRTTHFLSAPQLVARSDLIVTLPRRFARWVKDELGLVLLEPPLDVPGFEMKVAWHERHHHDPGHRWIRDQLIALTRTLLDEA